MLTLLLSPVGRIISGFAVAGLLLGGVYLKGRSDGRQSVLDRLAAERVEIFKDGKRIDDEVLDADDVALCRLLGGCVSDEAETD